VKPKYVLKQSEKNDLIDLAEIETTDAEVTTEVEEEMNGEILAEIIVETSAAETTDVAMTGITALEDMTGEILMETMIGIVQNAIIPTLLEEWNVTDVVLQSQVAETLVVEIQTVEIPAEVTSETEILDEGIPAEVTSETEILAVEIPAEVTLETEILAVEIPAEVTSETEILAVEIPAEVTLETEILAVEIPAEVTLETEILAVEIPAEVTSETEILGVEIRRFLQIMIGLAQSVTTLIFHSVRNVTAVASQRVVTRVDLITEVNETVNQGMTDQVGMTESRENSEKQGVNPQITPTTGDQNLLMLVQEEEIAMIK
jgi:hypothetical protein